MIRMVASFCLIATVALAQPVPEPEGFRAPPYRAPVPATLTGAQVTDGPGAVALYDAGAVFIDAMPRKKRPENLPEGTIWRDPVHMTIPGAIWLYDTGYEALAPAETDRLVQGLADATGGDLDAPVVIFCQAECWMSWNTAKRAVGLGYRNITWFPGGTNDWEAQGRDLVPARP